MYGLAITSLMVAFVAGFFGLTGIAGVASQISWIIFVFGLLLAILFTALGRRARRS
jgi:uncharacterized membrane protein YtjA (UPF0391 family)